MSKSKYPSDKATYLCWVRYFKDGVEKNSMCQLATFLAHWISFFVFLSLPEDALNSFIFLMAALLASKKPLPLGPWILGSLYSRLDECTRNIF